MENLIFLLALIPVGALLLPFILSCKNEKIKTRLVIFQLGALLIQLTALIVYVLITINSI